MTDAKTAVRQRVLASRRGRSPEQRAEIADAITAHLLALAPVSRARTVAAYRSMPGEPGTGPLLEALAARDVTTLLPVTNDDGSLTWIASSPGDPTRRSSLGVEEPIGASQAGEDLAACGVVIVPALSVDHSGMRLGRGAGFYDRAIAGLPSARRPLLIALVHSEELVPAVPHETGDQPVDLAVTEAGVFRIP